MRQKYIFISLLVFFILAFSLTPLVIKNYSIDNLSEPKNGQYSSDELSFLKTFYLMKKSNNYYQAFKEARQNLSTPDLLSGDTFLWRMPTVFYIWLFLANSGEQILSLFLFFSLTFLFCSYLILKKITKWFLGLMAVLILIPYLLDTLRYKTAFLFTEWWGLFFFIFGVTTLFYEKTILTIIFFSIAVLTRELFVLPVLVFLIFSWIKKEKIIAFVVPLVIFGGFYLVHRFFIAQIILSSTIFNIWSRLHAYNLGVLRRMVSFSMRNYIVGGLKTHYLLFVLGLVSVLCQVFLSKRVFFKKNNYKVLGFITLSLLTVLPFVAVYDNDYWGIFFMPLLLIQIPILFNLKIKDKNRSIKL